MNLTKTISLESLDRSHYSINSDELNNELKLGLTLDADYYDDISLYGDQDDTGSTSRRLTWEEWYIKKKIEALKKKPNKENKDDKKGQKVTPKKHVSDEEKNRLLLEWYSKKLKEKQAQIEKHKIEKAIKDEETEKKRKESEEKYKIWLEKKNGKEREKKAKKAEEERREKEKKEREKQKREELIKLTAKGDSSVRPMSQKKGVVLVNGKERKVYDWSTSPQPSFFNKQEWKS